MYLAKNSLIDVQNYANSSSSSHNITSVGCYVILLSDAVAIATLQMSDKPLCIGTQYGAVDASNPELPQVFLVR